MSDKTGIEWADVTWNPVRGCTKISPGCKHCYAETFAERWRGTPGHAYEQGFDLRLAPHKLAEPLRWTEPRAVFVNSMSDLFQASLPIEYTARVVDVMELANWHTFQLLTKRADLLLDYSRKSSGRLGLGAFKHVWVGVSVEDIEYGAPRIELLRKVKAHVRFLSIEPLLEDLGDLYLGGIDWVIVGGESGPGARPMRPEWVRNIQAQCQEQGVHFFFKQWGAWATDDDGETLIRPGKKQAGRVLDGRTWDAMPDRPVVALPSHADRKEMAALAAGWAGEWKGHALTKVAKR